MYAKESEMRTGVGSQGPASRTTAQVLCIIGAVVVVGATGCDEEVIQPGSDRAEELRRCRPAGGVVYSDEDVRSIAGCQVLEGDLIVSHSVSDLSPLSSLKVIEGDISGGGFRSKPFSFDALHSLEIVSGDLHFSGDNVTSFQGLSNVHTVGGWLRLSSVPAIQDLRGLEKVRRLSRLDIMYNPELRTLVGLEGLEEVKGDVYFAGNALLPAEEIEALLARIQVGGAIHRF